MQDYDGCWISRVSVVIKNLIDRLTLGTSTTLNEAFNDDLTRAKPKPRRRAGVRPPRIGDDESGDDEIPLRYCDADV
jgi:hypothetical protein